MSVQAFADSNGMSFSETSAKDSVNVEAAFMQLTGELLAMRRKEEEEATAEAAAAAAAAPLEATEQAQGEPVELYCNSVAVSDNVSQEKVAKIVDKYMDLDGDGKITEIEVVKFFQHLSGNTEATIEDCDGGASNIHVVDPD